MTEETKRDEAVLASNGAGESSPAPDGFAAERKAAVRAKTEVIFLVETMAVSLRWAERDARNNMKQNKEETR